MKMFEEYPWTQEGLPIYTAGWKAQDYQDYALPFSLLLDYAREFPDNADMQWLGEVEHDPRAGIYLDDELRGEWSLVWKRVDADFLKNYGFDQARYTTFMYVFKRPFESVRIAMHKYMQNPTGNVESFLREKFAGSKYLKESTEGQSVMNFEYDKKISVPEGISFRSTHDGLIYWKHQFPFNKITSYLDSIITEDPRISLHRFNLAGPRLGKVFLYFYVGGVIGVSNMRTDNFENGVRRGLPADEIYNSRDEDVRTDTRFISTLGTPVEVPSLDWHRKHGVYNDRFDEALQDVKNSYDTYSEVIDGYTLLASGDELLTTYNWNEYNNEGKLDKFADIFQQDFALKILPNLFSGFYELVSFDYRGESRDLWSFKAKFTEQLKQQIENGELVQ